MRLLDTRTGEFYWINDPEDTRYAILSHVWSKEGEQSFQDLQRIQAEVRAARAHDPTLPADAILQCASPKIRDACAYARADGLDYIWIDSCCIDKTSSAELSEAINSMYAWYSQSIVCYAFLHDVVYENNRRATTSHLRQSAWFTRGWTLQELIAPRVVIFVSAAWRRLGDKAGLSRVVSDITGIDDGVLNHSRSLSSVSVARRMSWASKRATTRKEDEAYSLMGIFGVNMPTIYGEGRLAFVRLQEEILMHIPDQSIFAWNLRLPFPLRPSRERVSGHGKLFAVSPAWFMHSGHITSIPREDFSERLRLAVPPSMNMMAPYGLRSAFPLIPVTSRFHLAILACEDCNGLLAFMLVGERSGVLDPVGIASIELDALADLVKWYRPRLRPYAVQRWKCMRLSYNGRRVYLTACGDLRMAEVYISRGPQLKNCEVAPPLLLHAADSSQRVLSLRTLHAPSPAWSKLAASDHVSLTPFYHIRLATRCAIQLTRQQYDIFDESDGNDLSGMRTFALYKMRSSITIQVGPCACVAERSLSGRVTRLALALSVSVSFPSVTTHSDWSPVMFAGYASDRDRRILVEHDWDHPAHNSESRSQSYTDAIRRAHAHAHNAFSSQAFSYLDRDGRGAQPFLQLVLDQDCPGDIHYPARFTLSIDLNAAPRAPAFPPMRWYLLGPVPRAAARGRDSGKKRMRAEAVGKAIGTVSANLAPALGVLSATSGDFDLLRHRLWKARDKLAQT